MVASSDLLWARTDDLQRLVHWLDADPYGLEHDALVTLARMLLRDDERRPRRRRRRGGRWCLASTGRVYYVPTKK